MDPSCVDVKWKVSRPHVSSLVTCLCSADFIKSLFEVDEVSLFSDKSFELHGEFSILLAVDGLLYVALCDSPHLNQLMAHTQYGSNRVVRKLFLLPEFISILTYGAELEENAWMHQCPYFLMRELALDEAYREPIRLTSLTLSHTSAKARLYALYVNLSKRLSSGSLVVVYGQHDPLGPFCVSQGRIVGAQYLLEKERIRMDVRLPRSDVPLSFNITVDGMEANGIHWAEDISIDLGPNLQLAKDQHHPSFAIRPPVRGREDVVAFHSSSTFEPRRLIQYPAFNVRYTANDELEFDDVLLPQAPHNVTEI